MGTCSTCVFWRFGCCDRVQVYQDDEADLVKRANEPGKGMNILVQVADNHNLNVELKTSPDFGCNCYKENVLKKIVP